MRCCLAILVLASCTATTEFDPGLLGEDSANACTDELDNDGDGLTDCQDLGCLTHAACCNVPTVVFETSFESPDCGAPDPAEWNSWGAPEPIVCDGAFRPNKAEACYDVGAVTTQSVSLREGMTVVADVVGRPEPKGRLILAFTFQSDIVGSLDPCAPIEALHPFVFMRQEPVSSGGYRWSAGYDQSSIGLSEVIADDGPHTVSLSIGEGGFVEYAVDGKVFAVSPDSRVVDVDRPAFVAIGGRGFSAGFEALVVVSGSQCETPDRWEPAGEFVAMDAADDYRFDSLEVLAPVVVPGGGGDFEMYYTGCDRQGTCDMGRAFGGDAGFERDPNNPVVDGEGPWWYRNTMILDGDECTYTPYGRIDELCYDHGGGVDNVARELWEIRNGDDLFIWYSVRAPEDGLRRIGVVASSDGGKTFDVANPDVIPLSGADDVDGRGVRAATVIYDPGRTLYQMWFAAEGALGATTSIGYAVSSDGIHWQRYPEPVVRAEDVGLDRIGRPSVLFDGAKLRMFVEGTEPGDSARNIYELVNRGLPYDELP